jgi:hypothetical protein
MAQDTLFLKKDSLMISTGPKVNFKGDTTIIVNRKGEVIEGILLKNTYLWTGRRLILFSGSSVIRFILLNLHQSKRLIKTLLSGAVLMWFSTTRAHYYRENSPVTWN